MNLRWKVAQAAEIRWWRSYLKEKPKAAYLNWKRDYWNELLAKCDVIPRKGETALDAGCGPAGIFMVLEQQKVDALDPLLDQYETQLQHFDKTEYPWVNFIAQPLEKYESPQTKYDKVFCMNVINHVADLNLCLDKLIGHTRTAGQFILSVDAHNYSFFKRLFRLLPGDILHPHQYDLKEYQEMLTKRQCKVLKAIRYKREFFFDYYILICEVGK